MQYTFYSFLPSGHEYSLSIDYSQPNDCDTVIKATVSLQYISKANMDSAYIWSVSHPTHSWRFYTPKFNIKGTRVFIIISTGVPESVSNARSLWNNHNFQEWSCINVYHPLTLTVQQTGQAANVIISKYSHRDLELMSAHKMYSENGKLYLQCKIYLLY
jgi:hypothetical protein